MPRVLMLALVVISAGCLYTGDLNHAPTCTVGASAQSTHKGTAITFTVNPKDQDAEDQPTLQVAQRIIASNDGQPVPLANCDYVISAVLGNVFTVTFYRTGSYQVSATVVDQHGAVSEPSGAVIVLVGNAPPMFPSNTMIVAGGMDVPDFCGFYIVGKPIVMYVSQQAVDTDQNATTGAPNCPPAEVIAYNWTVTPPPGSLSALFTEWDDQKGQCGDAASATVPFPAVDGMKKVCLWPDFAMPNAGSLYTISVTATDEVSTTAAVNVGLTVKNEGPPCLTGLYPPVGSYVIDPQNPTDFDLLRAGSVADQVDGYPGGAGQLTFIWTLWRDSDPTWRTIPVSGPSYSPDYSIFGVGEHVRIRVAVVDRTSVAPSCADTSLDTCQVKSCAMDPTLTCNQWATWNLEMR
jgi:hypothetical protein